MKTTFNIFFLGLMISAGAFAQEGELVSIDAETKRAYYTRNDDYKVESDGSFTGNIVAYHESGKTEETGALNSGVKVGVWVKYNEDGQKTGKGSYKDGLKEGEWKVWDGNGTLRIVMNYEKGKRVGEWLFYDENGNLLKTKVYTLK
jgi:antitoxin component YwqK of YwqJK toxin-antitoxin module